LKVSAGFSLLIHSIFFFFVDRDGLIGVWEIPHTRLERVLIFPIPNQTTAYAGEGIMKKHKQSHSEAMSLGGAYEPARILLSKLNRTQPLYLNLEITAHLTVR
jgi:hypothetical protein